MARAAPRDVQAASRYFLKRARAKHPPAAADRATARLRARCAQTRRSERKLEIKPPPWHGRLDPDRFTAGGFSVFPVGWKCRLHGGGLRYTRFSLKLSVLSITWSQKVRTTHVRKICSQNSCAKLVIETGRKFAHRILWQNLPGLPDQSISGDS